MAGVGESDRREATSEVGPGQGVQGLRIGQEQAGNAGMMGDGQIRFRMLPDPADPDQKKAKRKAQAEQRRAEREAQEAAERQRRRSERVVAMREGCKVEHRLDEVCGVCTVKCHRAEVARDERIRKALKKKAKSIKETGENPDLAATRTTFGVVIDPAGDKAYVRVAENSPAGMAKRLGLPAQHKAAVERLQRDYEVSAWNARAASFEMAVDGSGNPTQAAHLHVVEAQQRLRAAAQAVGKDWPLVQATMLPPFVTLTTLRIQARIGYSEARRRLDLALDALAEFYTPGRMRKDPLLRICVEIVEKAAREVV